MILNPFSIFVVGTSHSFLAQKILIAWGFDRCMASELPARFRTKQALINAWYFYCPVHGVVPVVLTNFFDMLTIFLAQSEMFSSFD